MAGKMGRQRMGSQFGNNHPVESSGLVKRGLAEVRNGKLVSTRSAKNLFEAKITARSIPKRKDIERIAEHLKATMRVTIRIKDWSDRQEIERVFAEVLERPSLVFHRSQRMAILADVRKLLRE
jgi:hypothetical protein